MVEGADLESLYTRKGIKGSNPFLSAIFHFVKNGAVSVVTQGSVVHSANRRFVKNGAVSGVTQGSVVHSESFSSKNILCVREEAQVSVVHSAICEFVKNGAVSVVTHCSVVRPEEFVCAKGSPAWGFFYLTRGLLLR